MAKGDKYFRGHGKVWLSSVEYIDAYKCKFTRKDKYETIPDPNGNGEIQVFMGYSIEGSITIRKSTNLEFLNNLKNHKSAFELPIQVQEINPDTGDFEIVSYQDCTIEEFPLSDFENRKITEIEISVKARDYTVLDTMGTVG